MKVSGFTFVRNAVKNDYPIVEAILSALETDKAFQAIFDLSLLAMIPIIKI